MSRESTYPPRKLKDYLTGFTLALILTSLAFGVVSSEIFSRTATLQVIGAAAVVQILVHLRYFLHLRLRATSPQRILALVFATVLVLIMIGGSLWIMLDLHYRMQV